MTESERMMMKTGELFTALLKLPLLAIPTIFRGYVISVIWGWFIVGQFGLPAISMAMAVGINALIVMLVPAPTLPKEKTDWWANMLYSILWPALGLLTAWVAHLFL